MAKKTSCRLARCFFISILNLFKKLYILFKLIKILFMYRRNSNAKKKTKNYTIKYNFSMGKEDLKEIMEESFLIYFKRKEHNCILKNKSRIK